MKPFAAVLFLLVPILPARTQCTIGYFHAAGIMADMPESDTAEVRMKEWINQLDRMVNERTTDITRKTQMLDSMIRSHGDQDLLRIKTDELNQLQKEYEELEIRLTKLLEEKQEEFLQPVKRRLQNAVQEVATELKLQYVIDADEVSLWFSNPAGDISSAIREKLGLP